MTIKHIESGFSPAETKPVSASPEKRACTNNKTICQTTIQELDVAGEDLPNTINEWVKQCSVRRIIIQNAERYAIAKIPLTISTADCITCLESLPEAYAITLVASMVAYPHIILEIQGSCTISASL